MTSRECVAGNRRPASLRWCKLSVCRGIQTNSCVKLIAPLRRMRVSLVLGELDHLSLLKNRTALNLGRFQRSEVFDLDLAFQLGYV